MSHEAHVERRPGFVSLDTLEEHQADRKVQQKSKQDKKKLFYTPGKVLDEDKSFFYSHANNEKKEAYRQTRSKRTAAMFPASFISEADLSKWLFKVGVDVAKFGIGNYRTISNLLTEVNAGKSRLVLHNIANTGVPRLREFEVVRVIHVTNLIMFNPKKDKCLVESSRKLKWLKGDAQTVLKNRMPPSFKMNTSQFPPNMSVREGVQIGAANCLLKEFHLKVTRTLLQAGVIYTLSPEEVASTAAANRRKKKGNEQGSMAVKTNNLVQSKKGTQAFGSKEATTTSTSLSYPGLPTACHVHSINIEISPNRVVFVPQSKPTVHAQAELEEGMAVEAFFARDNNYHPAKLGQPQAHGWEVLWDTGGTSNNVKERNIRWVLLI
jgi:hypothetical protein